MNTKKKRVCYQVNLQQMKLYVKLSSSMHLCRLRMAYLTQKCILLLITIHRTMLKDMTELKDITGFVSCMYGNFWWLGCVLSVSEE
jgi:hypothetical protein